MPEPVALSLTEAFAALGTRRGRQDPYPLYEAIRAHGDLARRGPGRLVVTGYDACARALRDPRLHVQDRTAYDAAYPAWRSHSSLRAFTSSMLYSNGPDHSRLRSLAGFAFTPPRVRDLAQVVEDMADRLLDRMTRLAAAGEPVDVIAEFASRLPVAVIGAVLGFPEEDQVWFRETASAIAVATDGFSDPSALHRADAAMDDLARYFDVLVDDRRRRPADDLLTTLTAAHDGEPRRLSHEELMGTLMVLLTAGFETTSFLIGHGVMIALDHAPYARRLREEPDFADAYVEEILRYEPPVHVTSRFAADDTELLGTAVPRGTRLTLIMAAANRDPLRFTAPDRFDPARGGSPGPLSFGAGPHYCLGAPLARLEARIALPRLLRRFPRLAASAPPVYRDRWVVRGLDTYPLVLGA